MIDMDHLRTDAANVLARDIDDAEAHCARVAMAFAALVEPLRAWADDEQWGCSTHWPTRIAAGACSSCDLLTAWRSVEARIAAKGSTP